MALTPSLGLKGQGQTLLCVGRSQPPQGTVLDYREIGGLKQGNGKPLRK